MTADDLEAHLKALGYTVEIVQGQDGQPYTVVRSYAIPAGSLAGAVCDVAILRTRAVPYVFPPAIHTKPALVPMNTSAPHHTQPSAIGTGWQYWSRILRGQPTPRAIVTHIATIFSEV